MCNNEMINNFERIIELCENEADKMQNAIGKAPSEYKSNIFSKCDTIQCKEINNKSILAEQSGIYFFVITNNTSLPNDFDGVKYGAKTNENFKEEALKEWDVFYLGKTEGSLDKRIKEHCVKSSTKTYSLKLDDKRRERLKEFLKVYMFTLNKEYQEYAKLILSTVESFLHGKCNPKIGSSRV